MEETAQVARSKGERHYPVLGAQLISIIDWSDPFRWPATPSGLARKRYVILSKDPRWREKIPAFLLVWSGIAEFAKPQREETRVFQKNAKEIFSW